MIAFAGMLVEVARGVGMKVPEDPEQFRAEDYPHFAVFATVQLGAPMPYPSALDNATLIAGLSDSEIRLVTVDQLLERGLAVGPVLP